MSNQIERLATGLQTLKNTNKDVTALKEDLKIKMIDVNAKKAGCASSWRRWASSAPSPKASRMRRRSSKVAPIVRPKMRERSRSPRLPIAVAQPALDAAKDAVNCLDKASVTELKSFAKPPSGVDKVTDALLILVKGAGKKGLGWDPAKEDDGSRRQGGSSLHSTRLVSRNEGGRVVFLSIRRPFGPKILRRDLVEAERPMAWRAR